MAIEMDSISAKLDKLDKLVEELESKIKKSDVILDLPKAVGAIADCQKEMLEMLSIMKGEEIEWWLDGRTLLASARTKELLPWDSILEIGMSEETWNVLVDSDILSKNDFKLEENVISYVFPPAMGAMKPQIRINVWERKNDGILRNDLFISSEVLLPLEERKLGGLDFPAPANTLKYLNILYGSEWMQIV